MASIMFMPPPVMVDQAATQAYRAPVTGRSLLNVRAHHEQGKVAELRLELQQGGGKKDRSHSVKKIALKKIVANMTMSNNDMIALFPDVVACMGIESLEIKKMSVHTRLSIGSRRRARNGVDELTTPQKVLSLPSQLCQDEARDRIESFADAVGGTAHLLRLSTSSA